MYFVHRIRLVRSGVANPTPSSRVAGAFHIWTQPTGPTMQTPQAVTAAESIPQELLLLLLLQHFLLSH